MLMRFCAGASVSGMGGLFMLERFYRVLERFRRFPWRGRGMGSKGRRTFHADGFGPLQSSKEMDMLIAEIKQAHSEWQAANLKLDWVVEKDQIDYAIYSLEAAEKRYEMLLRQAKQLQQRLRNEGNGAFHG